MAQLPPTLRPWQPTADMPFGDLQAGHLLNRAGFGGTPAEVEAVVQLGPAGAINLLLDFPDAPAAEQTQQLPDERVLADIPITNRDRRAAFFQVRGEENEGARQLLQQKIQRASAQYMADATRWWLNRMAYGPYPLQERLTLFWHGHFTSSYRDDRQGSWRIWNQNELLRQHAAGSFREMVRGISRDPAMLKYLNNDRNVKRRPNENYARELMELFTLGIGNYTEADIKQAARAFTGWTHDGVTFLFRGNQHDDEVKRLFGRVGAFGGDEVIELLLTHPACGRYIAGKLFAYFVGTPASELEAAALGEVLREHNFEMRPMLRTILSSRAFFDPKRFGGKIKSPVHLLAGTCRLLEAEVPDVRATRRELEKMGQVLFEPPNVKGWPGQFDGRKWINTATLLARYNAAVALVERSRVKTRNPSDPGEFVDEWLNRLIGRPVEADKRARLIELADEAKKRTRVLELIVSMPEYQLC